MSRNHDALDWRRWQKARRETFERDKFRCRSCGRPGRLEAHHLVRIEDGGPKYCLSNLEARCRSCHISEHRRPLTPGEQEWAAFVRELLC